MFLKAFPNAIPPPPQFRKPKSHTTQLHSPSTESWLLDIFTSHDVTTNLNNQSLHATYDGTNKLIAGDDMGLTIAHFSFLSFPLHSPFIIVPVISINIIIVSQLWNDDNVAITFSHHYFL